ncbi:cytochrome P450 [Nonomuraea thailandensis]|uniref:Cytochrome P450 n=1 Tax=Nonomuraea thailandensis TaxID=1188745 RepID=A0A9X2GGU9_9ACTN|nr:cytochrome P450 [Nonomuraea thailandensis]MCP2357417.1 cytochrome P450 [Nonomuraea thailandensis]
MATDVSGRVRAVSLRQVLAGSSRGGPFALIDRLSRQSRGEIIRLGLGPFRPFLVSHPEHLAHVLRGGEENYPRGAAMWKALGRLTGDGIAGQGPRWLASRDILRSALSAKYLHENGEQIAASVAAGVEDLERRLSGDRPVDAGVEMTRMVYRVINPAFFGSRFPQHDCERLGAAIAAALSSLVWRMALPGVPHAVPLPGDRAFRRANRTVDDLLHPVIGAARRGSRDGRDLITALLNGAGADGEPLSDDHVSDDIVALFVAGAQSSSLTLQWLWVVLSEHPEVAGRLREEADEVLGQGPPRPEHARRLTYTQMVLSEVMRVYSMAWAVARVAVADDVIDGVEIPAGSTVVLSPYLTHRLPDVWQRPLEFMPERFAKERVRGRHPLAYLPFGAGRHQCVGQAFVMHEVTLIVACLMNRFEVRALNRPRPRLGMMLEPDRPVGLKLTPRRPRATG